MEIYSQREDTPGDDDAWTRHATGQLTPAARGSGPAFDFTAWPPPAAEPVEVGDFYAGLTGSGYGYGPAFQGLRAAWRRGAEVFAEVALPEDQRADAGAYGIHPALLDAALHLATAAADGPPETEPDSEPNNEPGSEADAPQVRLLFAWTGLVLHAAGATALRVRLVPVAPGTVSLEAADEVGGLVVTADSLISRPVPAAQLNAAAATKATDSLFKVAWTDLAPAQGAPSSPSWTAVATGEQVASLADDVEQGAPAPAAAIMEAIGNTEADGDAALDLASQVLEVVQCWQAGAGLEESRLLVVTRGAVPAGDAAITDPAGAAVWGLVRAAQAENPGQIILVDADPESGTEPLPAPVLAAVLASGEPQLAVRGTALSVPRLALAGHAPDAPATLSSDGTVLITGAGSLGALLARHLVTRHRARHLMLASRRGPDADGAAALAADLAALGAQLTLTACDVSDRAQLKALLASVPEDHPLTAVVHTAGVLDDGVIGSLTPERLAGAFAPKVNAVRHLDELTRDLDLGAFIAYSSAAGVFMGAGSGSYAAANAFLDGLMASRRAAGLPGLSLAWGPWDYTSGLVADLNMADQARINRQRATRDGVLAITPAEGLDLFDAAVGSGHALLIPAKLDLRGIRAGATAGREVPHLLRGLAGAGRPLARAADTVADRQPLSDRLAGLPAAEQAKVLLDLVRAQAVAVLGYSPAHQVDADQGLFEMGFDSLTSIELRNRLRNITGMKLSPNLVFAYPTPGLLAAHLHELIRGDQPADPQAISE